MTSDTRAIGTLPPVGDVPDRMLAMVVRRDRFGEPRHAFRIEELPTPQIGPDEVLVAVMAAGINYNNVFAARGVPIDVIESRMRAGATEDYHIGGSDASGIVYAVGESVHKIRVGDEVVIHHGWWDEADPWIQAGKDPMLAPSARIWGYDTNHGSFAQFTVAQAHQCLPKAACLSWEEAAASTLVGTTAYRMLFGWAPNTVQEGDVVLVWGGSGGLGTQAIQLVRHARGIPIAVVSSAKRGEFCVGLGAAGWIDRTQFNHWGVPPSWRDINGQKAWTAQARAFGKKIWEIAGERKSPAIVFEHPGEDTVPTSIFLADNGGMVVICAGTTGYSAVVDLRYHWTRQKRLQGSHGTNDLQAKAYNDLIRAGHIDPTMSRVLRFEEVPRAHQEMAEGKDVLGNTSILVGAPEPGHGRRD